MKISWLLLALISPSLFNHIFGLENDDFSLKNDTSIPNFNTSDNGVQARASIPQFKRKVFKQTKEYCFNVPKGETIPDITHSNNFERLVVYFYNFKDINTKLMYVPGITKQHMIPDLPIDKEDLILDSGPLQVNDIFSAANLYIITNSKNKKDLFDTSPAIENNNAWDIKKPVDNLNNKWENEMYFNEFLNPKDTNNLELHNEHKEPEFGFDVSNSNKDILGNTFDQLLNWHPNKNTADLDNKVTDESEVKDTEIKVDTYFNSPGVNYQYDDEINDRENTFDTRVFQKQILLKILIRNGVTIDANQNLRDPKGQVFHLNDIYFVPIIEKTKKNNPATYFLNSIAIVLKNTHRIVNVIKMKHKVTIDSYRDSTKNTILDYFLKRPAAEEAPSKLENLFIGFPKPHVNLKHIYGSPKVKLLNRPTYNKKKPCRTLACKLQEQMEDVPVAPRIIGGSAATASGFPIRNRGRSGLIL